MAGSGPTLFSGVRVNKELVDKACPLFIYTIDGRDQFYQLKLGW